MDNVVTRIKTYILLLLLMLTHSVYAQPSVSLLLDWYINPNHAPILVAISDGYFKKNGIEVKLIEPSDTADQAKFVALKKVDIALTYQPHYFQEIKHHLPIQQVGTLIPTPLDCLVYLPSSGIHTAKDVKGKRVGYSDASDEFQLLKAVLKSASLSMDDITLINVHYSLTQALMMGKIDLAVGMMRNVEPVILQQYHLDPHMFYPEHFDIAPYSELIYIAPAGKVSPSINAFFQALKQSTEYLQHHPNDAWQHVIQQYPQLNTPTNHAIWQKTYPLFAKDPKH